MIYTVDNLILVLLLTYCIIYFIFCSSPLLVNGNKKGGKYHQPHQPPSQKELQHCHLIGMPGKGD